jgi:LmbE family N-acetylglucosaminyl deacetylase
VLKIRLDIADDNPLRVLCLGAHCDDIEIGCGGTILRLIEEYRNLQVRWVAFASSPERVREAERCAALFLKSTGPASVGTVDIREFKDGYFPYVGADIKDQLEQLKDFSPDLIFTHYRHDLHQDHRLISELTWNTFRNHQIWEYEVPKYDGDLSSPNLFVHLDESICRRKVEYVITSYVSQAKKHWFTEDTFLAILRLRGMESASPSRYAEAFYSRKLSL